LRCSAFWVRQPTWS